MTIFVPLAPSAPIPASPSFLLPPRDPAASLTRTVHAIMKAKRIVIICGAGISVQAGIPDFRSSDGLFQSMKRDNPKEIMSSGKELFDISVFNSEQKTSLFCQMIAQLSDLSQAAQPTPFHHLLRALDDRGRLLRVYTQNIDAIEQKSGLSFGVPPFEATKRSKSKPSKPTTPSPPSTSRLPTPPPETPRCIPLHGTLQSMHCLICNHSFPLLHHYPALRSGHPPPCPECTSLAAIRAIVGKRPRGIGKLRPSVVLYNEAHKDGEGVGDVVRKDLMGRNSAADLLLVVGTSLRVPGTKRMVREFAKAVRVRAGSSKDDPSTPGTSPRRSPTAAADEDPLPKAVYLNLDFPVPTREWEGVFDAWVQGDAQEFAALLKAEIEKEARTKEVASERKRKRDEAAAAAAAEEDDDDNDVMPDLLRSGTRGKFGNEKDSPTKRRPAHLPVSPTPSPSTKKRKTRVPPPPSSDDEDVDEDDRFRASPKLTVRIPPPHSRPRPYYVPEVYITSKAPQYLRRYEMISAQGGMPGIRQQPTRRTSPVVRDDAMDDIDLDVEIEDADVDVVMDDGSLSSSSSSSLSSAPSNSSSSETSTSSPASSSSSPPGFCEVISRSASPLPRKR